MSQIVEEYPRLGRLQILWPRGCELAWWQMQITEFVFVPASMRKSLEEYLCIQVLWIRVSIPQWMRWWNINEMGHGRKKRSWLDALFAVPGEGFIFSKLVYYKTRAEDGAWAGSNNCQICQTRSESFNTNWFKDNIHDLVIILHSTIQHDTFTP